MNTQNHRFAAYASNVYAALDFDQAFQALQEEIFELGFDGVIYTCIPQLLVDNQFHVSPVYHVAEVDKSDNLARYIHEEFARVDPLFQAIANGAERPIVWSNKTSSDAGSGSSLLENINALPNGSGIKNGVTFPVLNGTVGIGGVSVISNSAQGFDAQLDENLEMLYLCIRLFHNNVQGNMAFQHVFIKPFLDILNETELQLLIGMAKGKSQAQIASELGRKEGYLEQVIIKLRRKFSGVESFESPTINRNQLLYFAGLLNIFQFYD